MSRYFESAAVRNEENAVARVLESGAVATGGLPITETWTGSNGTPWASPPWTITNVLASFGFAVVTNTIQGNRGRLTAGSGPYTLAFATHDDSTHTDVDITLVYAVSDLSEKYVEVFWRMGATATVSGTPGFPGNCYALDIQPNLDQVNLTTLDNTGVGVNVVTINTAGVNVTTDINVHIRVRGNNHKARWWTGTEPSTWQIDWTDVANTYTSGKFGLGLYNGDNNDTEQVEFDSLSITAPTVVTTFAKGVGAVREATTATDINSLVTSWYYDWASYSVVGGGFPPVPTTTQQYVPMMWGDWILDSRWGTATGDGTLGGDPASSIGTSSILLGFNEPNITAQANMTVARALALWPQLEATGARLGSPAMSPNSDGITWLDAFFAASPRCEFLCVHWYPEWNGGYADVGDYLDYMHTRYGLPIWLTEVGSTAGTIADNAALMPAVMAACASRPWVERVAWFALTRNPAGGDGYANTVLVNPDGSLNAAGTQYATYPAGTVVGGPVPIVASSSGTSTVAGTLSTTKTLAAAAAGTSTVTAAMGVTRGLASTTAVGAGATTSALGVDRPMVASAAGTSMVTAAMAVARPLAGSSAGTSTVTGSFVLPQGLAGASAGTSAVTAALTVAIPLASASAGSSNVTAALGLTKNMAAAAAGAGTVTAALTADHPMVGASGGAGTAGATLTVVTVHALAGSSAGVAATTAALSVVSANVFNGASNGVSTVTGALGVAHTLAGSAAGTSSTTSALANGVGLASTTAAGTSTASSPGMVAVRGLAGSSAGAATAASSGSQVAHPLASSSAGVAAVPTANLSVTAAGGLGGIVSGTSTATGSLSVVMNLAGSAAGSSTVAASLGRDIKIAATAAGTSTVTGTFSRALPLAGSSAGTSTAAGDLAKLILMAAASGGTSTFTATGMPVSLALSAAAGGLSNAVALIVVAYKLAAVSAGRATVDGALTTFRVTGVYGMWNEQIFDDMQYGDKKVIDWLMVSS